MRAEFLTGVVLLPVLSTYTAKQCAQVQFFKKHAKSKPNNQSLTGARVASYLSRAQQGSRSANRVPLLADGTNILLKSHVTRVTRPGHEAYVST